jgi:hypothetical protein
VCACHLGRATLRQAENTGSADSLSRLFHQLLALAFDNLGTGTPTVVGVEGAPAGLVHSWPQVAVDDVGQLANVVHERLSVAPVLLLPPWDASPNRQPAVRLGRVLPPETVLLECRPPRPESVLAVMTPMGTLTSERARPVRESLARHWQPAVVLYATGNVRLFHRGFAVAVVVFRARQRESPVLRIFRVPDTPNPVAVEEDFRQLLAGQHERGRYGYLIRDPLPAGESLQFERHDPTVLGRRADLAVYGGVALLGELFELPSPGVHLSNDRDLLCDEGDDGAVRVLGGRDIGRSGVIAPPDDRSRWARVPPGRQLRAGDLILRTIFHPTDRGVLFVGEVTAEELPAVADENVIVIRPRWELIGPQQHLLAVLFLRSPLARALALGVGGVHQLRRADLAELHLPLPDEALSAALHHVLEAGERLERWRREADGLLRSVFLDDSAAIARARIVTAGRKLRLRTEAASLVDDFGYMVRTGFPYPIAFRWRRVQASAGGDDPGHAYAEILDAAEVLLCYAAQLGLAISREAGITLGATAALRLRLVSGRGPGFGDWVAILQEIGNSRAIRRLPANHPLRDLGSLAADLGANSVGRRLNDRRNDEAHQRRVDPVDLPLAVEKAVADLAMLLEEAQFLADWPLIYFEYARWDTLRGTATVSYRQLMGDHAIVPHQTTERRENDLEQGSLYIIDSESKWHLLRPFLIGRDCPVCKNWSTFHVDCEKGTLVIKSLEHGHIADGSSVAEPLCNVGLL